MDFELPDEFVLLDSYDEWFNETFVSAHLQCPDTVMWPVVHHLIPNLSFLTPVLEQPGLGDPLATEPR